MFVDDAAEKAVDLPLGAAFAGVFYVVVFGFGWTICCSVDGVVVGV
jgi:hypothetical protein